MKKLISVLTVILVIFSVTVNISAITVESEYLTEAEKVSVIYGMTFNHYLYNNVRDENVSSAFYRNSMVTIDDLTQEEKIMVAGLVFLSFEGTAIYDDEGRIPLSHFEKDYERVFGEEFQYEENKNYYFVEGDRSFVLFGDTVQYIYPWPDNVSESSPVDVRTLYYVDRYVMEDNKLYVFDKYALVRVSEAKDGKVPVYSSSDSAEQIGYLDYDIDTDKCEFEDMMLNYHLYLPRISMENQGNYFSEEVDISAFSEYEDLLTEYVHIFECDGEGNWYWKSSSPVELAEDIPDTADGGYMIFVPIAMLAAAAMVIIGTRQKEI